jgi:hypothetical protein
MLRRSNPGPICNGMRKAGHFHETSIAISLEGGRWWIGRDRGKKNERRFAASGACHLYLRFALGQPIQSGAGIFDAETYIST